MHGPDLAGQLAVCGATVTYAVAGNLGRRIPPMPADVTLIRALLNSQDPTTAALADILSGRVNPSGRLPQTWYRSGTALPAVSS